VWPYLWATLAGLLPGTAAVVIVGNAFAGDGNPLMILVSVSTGALGLCGLVYEVRQYRRQHRRAQPETDHSEPASESAVSH
jgi:uncharacterized membrane protein YdjX (TVP38/TMEM64 family)